MLIVDSFSSGCGIVPEAGIKCAPTKGNNFSDEPLLMKHALAKLKPQATILCWQIQADVYESYNIRWPD